MQTNEDAELSQIARKAAEEIGNIHTKVIRGTYSFDADRAASIISEHFKKLGAKGGKVKSEKKTEAARQNARKPRKRGKR